MEKELLEEAALAFESTPSRSESPEREAELLAKIGELTVERDFLARGLERVR